MPRWSTTPSSAVIGARSPCCWIIGRCSSGPRTIIQQKGDLAPITADEGVIDDLGVEVGLELHPELLQLVAPDAGMVRPGRQQMSAVGTLAQFGRGARHGKVLEELDAAADGGVALREIAAGALPEPFGEGGAGGQGVDSGLGLQHVHGCLLYFCSLRLRCA